MLHESDVESEECSVIPESESSSEAVVLTCLQILGKAITPHCEGEMVRGGGLAPRTVKHMLEPVVFLTLPGTIPDGRSYSNRYIASKLVPCRLQLCTIGGIGDEVRAGRGDATNVDQSLC